MKSARRWFAGGLLALCLFLPAGLVAAQADVLDQACGENRNASVCKDNRSQDVDDNEIFGPEGIMTRVARLISIVSGVAGVIMIIIGGFRYILASGDATNINKAKSSILYALIGLVIAGSSQAIVVFVLNRL